MRSLVGLRTNRKGGFSLLEMMISVTVMALLCGALAESVANLRQVTIYSNDRSSLQTMADDTLLEMVTELRRSGQLTVGGKDYPYVFEGGLPDGDFINHAHDPAAGVAEFGDDDFGDDWEVVYLLPADADNDGRPDIDAAGDLSWGASEISYTVTTRADGINYLERRVDGANPSIVGHHVELMVVDTAESSAFEIPLETLRIRLFFRRLDSRGNLIRYSNEAVVALRNG